MCTIFGVAFSYAVSVAIEATFRQSVIYAVNPCGMIDGIKHIW